MIKFFLEKRKEYFQSFMKKIIYALIIINIAYYLLIHFGTTPFIVIFIAFLILFKIHASKREDTSKKLIEEHPEIKYEYTKIDKNDTHAVAKYIEYASKLPESEKNFNIFTKLENIDECSTYGDYNLILIQKRKASYPEEIYITNNKDGYIYSTEEFIDNTHINIYKEKGYDVDSIPVYIEESMSEYIEYLKEKYPKSLIYSIYKTKELDNESAYFAEERRIAFYDFLNPNEDIDSTSYKLNHENPYTSSHITFWRKLEN